MPNWIDSKCCASLKLVTDGIVSIFGFYNVSHKLKMLFIYLHLLIKILDNTFRGFLSVFNLILTEKKYLIVTFLMRVVGSSSL